LESGTARASSPPSSRPIPPPPKGGGPPELFYGQEALIACERQEYTQILCDLRMPILDGQGFYQALSRCQPQLCGRVIFMTGNPLTPTLQAFLAHMRVPVLHKPFTPECLIALFAERCPSGRPT
jgi:CheY-like chemotaxis protein